MIDYFKYFCIIFEQKVNKFYYFHFFFNIRELLKANKYICTEFVILSKKSSHSREVIEKKKLIFKFLLATVPDISGGREGVGLICYIINKVLLFF